VGDVVGALDVGGVGWGVLCWKGLMRASLSCSLGTWGSERMVRIVLRWRSGWSIYSTSSSVLWATADYVCVDLGCACMDVYMYICTHVRERFIVQRPDYEGTGLHL